MLKVGGLVALPKQQWKQASETKLTPEETGRVPGEKPTLADLKRVVFGPTQSFEKNEIALIPRTRGGYCYAAVTGKATKSRCFMVPDYSHDCRRFRLSYSGQFKELPVVMIGKFPANTRATDEIEDVTTARETAGDSARDLGAFPSVSDLQRVVFSQTSVFSPDEVVMVPRSRGGFTYAKILNSVRCSCPPLRKQQQDQQRDGEVGTHEVDGWRVQLNSSGQFKDVMTALIGKVCLLSTAAPVPLSVTGAPTLGRPNQPPAAAAVTTVAEAARLRRQEQEQAARQRRDAIEDEKTRQSKMLWEQKQKEDEERRIQIQLQKAAQLRMLLGLDEPSTAAPPQDSISRFDDTDNESESTSAATPRSHNTSEAQTASLSQGEPLDFAAAEQAAVVDQVKDDFYGKLRFEGSDDEPSVAAPSAAVNAAVSGGLLHVGSLDLHERGPQQKQRSSATSHSSTRGEKSTSRGSRGSNSTSRRQQKQLVVIDGPNVAMKHGKKKVISVMGIRLAVDYYRRQGFDAIVFLPEHYLTRKPQEHGSLLGDFKPAADDVPQLLKMVEDGDVVLTPPQDYDDSYTIKYARKHNGCIVSNDRYWDYVNKAENKGWATKWIREHTISFTFARDEFLPNPDFVFPGAKPKAASTANQE